MRQRYKSPKIAEEQMANSTSTTPVTVSDSTEYDLQHSKQSHSVHVCMQKLRFHIMNIRCKLSVHDKLILSFFQELEKCCKMMF